MTTTLQPHIPGIPTDPRPRVRGMDAHMDAVFREHIARHGFARAAKWAPWLAYGERLPVRKTGQDFGQGEAA